MEEKQESMIQRDDNKSRARVTLFLVVLGGINLVLWFVTLSYGLSEISHLQQQIDPLINAKSHNKASPITSLEQKSLSAEELNVLLTDGLESVIKQNQEDLKEQEDRFNVDMKKAVDEITALKRVHSEFNLFWISLVDKIKRREVSTLPNNGWYKTNETELDSSHGNFSNEQESGEDQWREQGSSEKLRTDLDGFTVLLSQSTEDENDTKQYRSIEEGLPIPETMVNMLACRQGPPGDRGAVGPAGAAGVTGVAGEKGAPGIQGSAGVQGPAGLSGMPGAPGDKGDRGQQGAPGLAGHDGQHGFPGIPGDKGDRGFDGVPGADGISGPPGEPGRDGKDVIIPDLFPSDVIGAVLNTTLLMMEKGGLRGPPGLDGKDGTPGVDGEPGTDGIPGVDGTDGTEGINGTDGIDGIHGRDGENGIPGTPGQDGVDGLTERKVHAMIRGYRQADIYEIDGSFYVLHKEPKTWQSALNDCMQNWDGFLAGFRTESAFESFISQMKSRLSQNESTAMIEIWIGGKKLDDDSFHRVEIESEQSKGTMAGSWHTNEPSGDGECMDIWKSRNSFKLNDAPCSFTHPYLCELK